jgi:hypothetical protein
MAKKIDEMANVGYRGRDQRRLSRVMHNFEISGEEGKQDNNE